MVQRSVYMIELANLPDPIRHPIKAYKMKRLLLGLPGLIDIMHNHIGNTVLCFETVPHAERAQIVLLREDSIWNFSCGAAIHRGEQDLNTGKIKMLGVVNWPEGCE